MIGGIPGDIFISFKHMMKSRFSIAVRKGKTIVAMGNVRQEWTLVNGMR